jgi:ubiquitin carboxyl-terminal hydrolase 4/11/15
MPAGTQRANGDGPQFPPQLKSLSFWRLPPYAVISLKRFKTLEFRGRTTSRKIGRRVAFPLDGLDFGPWMPPGSPTDSPTYRLVSVVNHFGNAGGGHYTAYVRVREAAGGAAGGEWIEMNDRRCSAIASSVVCSAAAYILFYAREDVASARTAQLFPPDRSRPIVDLSTVGAKRGMCAVS